MRLIQPDIAQKFHVAKVYAEAFKSAGESWTQSAAENLVDFMIEHQPDMLFAIESDSRIVAGVWGMIKPWNNGNHLCEVELFVHPDFQHQGLSLLLYKAILTTAIDKYQIVEMEGLAESDRDFPLSYYKSLGRTETGLVHITGDPRVVLNNIQARITSKFGDQH